MGHGGRPVALSGRGRPRRLGSLRLTEHHLRWARDGPSPPLASSAIGMVRRGSGAVCLTGLTFPRFPPSYMLARLDVGRPAARAPPPPKSFLDRDLVWEKFQMYSRTPKRRAKLHAHARDRRSTGDQSRPRCDAASSLCGGRRASRAGASPHSAPPRYGCSPQGVRALRPRAGASPRSAPPRCGGFPQGVRAL